MAFSPKFAPLERICLRHGSKPLTRLALRAIHPLPQGERGGSVPNPNTELPFSP